jgi:hypothetical protein
MASIQDTDVGSTAAGDYPLPLPNLVIAGVAKAATTSLFRYLGQHPDICPSSVKEARYFTALRYGEPLAPVADYARGFRHWRNERYRMEATPGYFPGGRVVASAIDTLLPDSRVIVLLRDPVRRCWSWYAFMRGTDRIPREMGFPEYLDRCADLHAQDVDRLRENQPFWGLGGGCYDAWIDDWIAVFGDRLHIEFFDDLVASPRSMVEGVCEWLGVDAAPCASFDYSVENRTVQSRNRRLLRMARSLNRRGERFLARHPHAKRTLRGFYYRINADKAPLSLDDASRERLARFYGLHNERLAASLTASGRTTLPSWLTAVAPA